MKREDKNPPLTPIAQQKLLPLAPLRITKLPEMPETKSRYVEDDQDAEPAAEGRRKHGRGNEQREYKDSREKHASDHSRGDTHKDHRGRSSSGSGATPARRHAVPGERVWIGILCKTHSPDVRAMAIHMSGASIKGMVPAQLDIVGRISFEVSFTTIRSVCHQIRSRQMRSVKRTGRMPTAHASINDVLLACFRRALHRNAYNTLPVLSVYGSCAESRRLVLCTFVDMRIPFCISLCIRVLCV